MVDKIKANFNQPITYGKSILLLLISFAILGSVFFGALTIFFNNIIVLPQKNNSRINMLELRMSVYENDMGYIKTDIKEIKEDIKYILKNMQK